MRWLAPMVAGFTALAVAMIVPDPGFAQSAACPSGAPAQPTFCRHIVHFVDGRSVSERALNLVGMTADEVGRSFALVAGVSDYRGRAVPDLPPAAVDVEKLTRYLIDDQAFDEVVVLKDENFTEPNLRYFLQDYFPKRAESVPRSRFLFAFSGHGINVGENGYLLLPTAESLDDKFNSINLSVVRVMLQEVVSRAHHVLALINSCYGGNFVRRIGFGDRRLGPSKKGAHALTAGGANELVYHDPVIGPGSVFFELVLAGLDERADTYPPRDPADPRSPIGDGVITFDELSAYVRLAIQEHSGEDQNPLVGDLDPRGSLGSFFFFDADRVREGDQPRVGGAAAGAAFGPSASSAQDGPADLRQVQLWLAERGYHPGPADGRMGPRTSEAITQFQSDRGLPVTGTVDAVTVAQLRTREPSAAGGPVQPAVGVYPQQDRHGDVFSDCEVCPKMVFLGGGTFTRGSPPSEAGRDDDEGPQRRVRIAPFAIGQYEVTFEEWEACVADGGCNGHRPGDNAWGRGRRPVINVSWNDAQAYVDWLSRKTRQRYRLPTEAEWEFAARAETTTPFAFGETISTRQANYDGNFVYGAGERGEYRQKTIPVGSLAANAFGLYDMHGNVWEWVQDCYHGSYEGAPSDGSAWEEPGCSRRVLRGGSWLNNPGYLRSADRLGDEPDLRYVGGGFRVARTF